MTSELTQPGNVAFVARSAQECDFDVVALGEVMLRLDPGEERIDAARSFRAWEGGGEYNVARGLRHCFGERTAVVTALADNPIGRLVEGLMRQGGVDLTWLRWVPYDGIGRSVRNGLNFTERGFGPRAAVGCSDRANSAASQMKVGDVDWDEVFTRRGVRWLHTGSIFTALSPSTVDVAEEAMLAARRSGTVVSYDVNVRASLWGDNGGDARAVEVNRRLVSLCDVVFGNEKNFVEALGVEVRKADSTQEDSWGKGDLAALDEVASAFPNLRLIASTIRTINSASQNDWGGACWADGAIISSDVMRSIEILDRVGGGDAFAAGVIFGLLEGMPADDALRYGVAHGALAMSTPGDSSMATLAEVRRLADGGSARMVR
ncbi:MAG: sugar kinase [Acidimicrobiales bacterium]